MTDAREVHRRQMKPKVDFMNVVSAGLLLDIFDPSHICTTSEREHTDTDTRHKYDE